MNKLDKELYTKHAKRLAAIINPQSPFVQYLSRPDFTNILKLQLNVLSSLEKKFTDVKLEDNLKVTNLVSKFIELSKVDFKLDDKFAYPDEADYIDAINYLHTYCKNLFKVDIDDLVEGKKVEVAQPDVNLGADAHADAGGNGAPFMGTMGAMGGMEGMINPFAYGQASAKLNSELKEGKVYKFNSKPKAIPIIKLVLAIMTLLIAFVFILTSVFVFITNGMEVKYSGEVKHYSVITNGIFYIITGGFATYVGVNNILEIKRGKKNDNDKYSFTWFIYFGLLILVFMMPLIDLRSTWILSGIEITDTSIKKTIGFAGWRILMLIDIGLGALTLIPLIIGGVKAPKVDGARMESLLKDYMSEFAPSQKPASTGADVQKPVDVKPVDDKKDDGKKPDQELKS